MPRISEISLQNVRCFRAAQRARLGRITLLVGENSTGKSTFLGCYNAFATLSNLVDLNYDNPFDVNPFRMGNYDTIASKDTTDFVISGKYDNHIHSAAHFSYGRKRSGQPFEKQVNFAFSGNDLLPNHINMAISDHEGKGKERLSFEGPNFKFEIDWAQISFIPISRWLSRNVREGYLPYDASREIFAKRRESPVSFKEIAEFVKFVNFFRSEMPLPTDRSFLLRALSPEIPRRVRRYVMPPGYLSDTEEMTHIRRIGKTLGLWDDIVLNELDSDEGVEVFITISSETHHLIDVGYGVHSLLPVMNAIAVADEPSIFLLQQPEVHVHPVAQAKLAQYMAEGPHDFIIETHSDHLVDRFRLCVMEEVLRPDELSILYFERDGDNGESKIHNISVDSQGNVVNQPDSYRDFFLAETERLLGLR